MTAAYPYALPVPLEMGAAFAYHRVNVQHIEPQALPAAGAATADRDGELLAALQAGHANAAAMLYDRYHSRVNRLVWRLLGADSEHDDVVQQVFEAMLKGVVRVREAAALGGWINTVTVYTVRHEIRRRRLRRLVQPRPSELLPEIGQETDHEARDTLRRTYALLDQLGADLRIAFVLRFIDGESLAEVAAACDCSLATIKRRLKRAEERFVKLAAHDPVVAQRLRQSGRWKAR